MGASEVEQLRLLVWPRPEHDAGAGPQAAACGTAAQPACVLDLLLTLPDRGTDVCGSLHASLLVQLLSTG